MADLVLEARSVVRRLPPRGGALATGAGLLAVDSVSLGLGAGEVVALIGRSGAGKSTLARVLAGIERPDGGEVVIDGVVLGGLSGTELRRARRAVGLVLQDPAGALDPLRSVLRAVAEPLAIHRLVPPRAARDRAAELLALVGLPTCDDFLRRRPSRLSSGERQRVLLARALAGEPRALILDEPVSALDASVRGRLLNLLFDLTSSLGVAQLLIAHDLRLVAAFCSRVVVMELGVVVEEGPVSTVLSNPRHEATRALLGG